MSALAQERVNFSELCGFFSKQWDAAEAVGRHKYTLFGGARGPGKSYWLRWMLVRLLIGWAMEGHRNVRVMLASMDYPTLDDRQISKVEVEFPAWLGTYKTGDREFILAPEYGRGVLAFRNLDNPSKYKGSEWAAIAVDELTENPFRTFNNLRGSLRWPGIDQTKFLAASNPDGRYNGWVRQLWVLRDFSGDYEALAPMSDEFVFVPALPVDNPMLSEDYWNDLNTQPEHTRKAWVEGDWFASVEGLVYGEFNAENVSDYLPNPDLLVELAFDDGYVDPRAILFIQRTSRHIYVFDEIYESRRLEEEHVEAVLDRMGQWFGWLEPGEPGEEPRVVWENPDDILKPAVMPEIAIGSSEANILMRHFRKHDIVARGGTHKVVEGIKVVRRHVRDGKGYRALQVSPRCKHTIEEITTGYQYPPEGTKKDDEKPLDGNDHACDAFRYWAFMRAKK